MTEELKPCPFCGGEAVIVENERIYYIKCTNCQAEADLYPDEWNGERISGEPDEESGLKPCPFCGSYELRVAHHSGWDIWAVSCWPNCGVSTGDKWTKQEAIDAWNRRM